MSAANTDYFTKISDPGSATNLAAPGHSIGGTSITVDSTTGWPTDTGVIFAIDTFSTVNGVDVRDVGSYTVWEGVVSSGTTITSMTLRYGTDQDYTAGPSTRVYILPTSTRENRFVDGMRVEHKQTGAHSDIHADTLAVSGATTLSGALTGTTASFTSITVSGTATSQGWTALGQTPNTVTANSSVPKVFDMVFNGVDLTGTLSNGMKLQLARTVAAPSQCTSLNGTTQYYNRTSTINGMSFTDTFTASAWIKLTSYNGAINTIISRYNGTSGWRMYLEATGQLVIAGYNAASTNNRFMTSYASVPLNKWVHVAASFSMSDHTTSTCKMMFDGIDVGGTIGSGGTAPTSLIQAGNLEVGSSNGGTSPFNGKIAQAALYSAVITPATILASINRTLTGSETSLVSAYSFNNSINDLNTTNANNLTAQNSAVATNADSPFANAVAAGSLEYAEVLNVAFSTNTTVTVRVPDGCQLPTTGGISSVFYSTQSNPYGLPYFSNVLGYAEIRVTATTTSTTIVQIPGLTVPVYIPSGRRIKATIITYDANSTNSTAFVTLSICDGSVSTANTIARSITLMNVASQAMPQTTTAQATPTSGVHTFNGGFFTSGGTLNLEALVAAPTYLSVELV